MEKKSESAAVARVGLRFMRGRTEEIAKDVVEVVEIPGVFPTTPATVTAGLGFTLNMGDFNSTRVDVAITVPCHLEDVDAAYEWAQKWVETRVAKENGLLVEEIEAKKKKRSY